MRLSSKVVVAGLSVVAFGALISPALGGPSLKKLVKKEVSKQLANAQTQGPQGVQGPPGQTGAAAAPPGGSLPAGTTLTGVWAPFNGTGCSSSCITTAGNGVSFGYTLGSRPTAHVIPQAGPSTAQCPGSAAAPSALSGHLCVYVGVTSSGSTAGDSVALLDPVTQTNGISVALATAVTTPIGDSTVDTRGFKLTYTDGGSNISQASGTWAVTG